MTNTDTATLARTSMLIANPAKAGSELVRITVNNDKAAHATREIRVRLLEMNCAVQIGDDFHFNGHKLQTNYPDCAEALAKYRINLGNVRQWATNAVSNSTQ